MRSVENRDRQSRFGFELGSVLWVGMVAVLLGAAGLARAVQVDQTDIDVVIDPQAESMTAQVRLTVSDNAGDQQLVSVFLKPTRMDYCREAGSGRNVPYTFELVGSNQNPVYLCTMNLSSLGPECTLELGYAYGSKDFYGTGMNPTKLEDFSLGQITPQGVHSSHLFYYPCVDGSVGRGRIGITVPQGWMGVSAGVLQTQESVGDRTRFVYEIPYPSGMLPYPLAAAPYVVQEAVYQGRVRMGIYSAPADVSYAEEKLGFLTTKVLPFLEGLMGDYPLPNLRIVETFLKEGDVALATRGLVMQSQKEWFASLIGSSYTAAPVIALVDECAHQWNVYHVQFPNWLGEGLSDYTDNLFWERFLDSRWMAGIMPFYREAYLKDADLLNRLKPLADAGKTIEQAAQALGMTVDAVTPYWPYASAGEVAISDPHVFPTLYFYKGSMAMHALRLQIGDEQFFAGFKKLFAVGTTGPVTLDYCRACFEAAHGASLAEFFQRWYNEPGLPDLDTAK